MNLSQITNQDLLAEVSRRLSISPTLVENEVKTIMVDYSKTLYEMIAAGKYDWKNKNITTVNFPHDNTLGEVKVDVEYIHFDRYIFTKDALAEIDRRGFRPTTIHELLAFGAQYPEEQRKFPIIALGSVWTDRDGYRFVGCLSGNGSGRFLRLNYVEGEWYDRYRFLAVRK